MTGQLGVIYMLHFDQPYQHARHYVGKSESSAFLRAGLASDGGEFAGLACAVGEFWVRRVALAGSGARKPGAVIDAADLGAVPDGGRVADPEQVGEPERVAAAGVGFVVEPVGAQVRAR